MAEPGRSLASFQGEFADFLLAAELQPSADLLAWLADASAAAGPASRTELGLRVYRNNVIHSLTQALAAQFPVVRKLVGAEFFSALARDYVRQEPPTEAELTCYGHRFGAFITTVPACQPMPYLADVASLELQCQRALHAADDPVLAIETLQMIDPEQLANMCFTLHSSTFLFASDYPVDRIWAANIEDSQEEIRLDTRKRHHMLIYRPALRVYVVTLQLEAFTLLQQLQAGNRLEQACERVVNQHSLDHAQLAPLLGYLFGLGVFSHFTSRSGKENS